MPTPIFLGEFEQLVLLSILRCGDEAVALRLRADLSAIAGRDIARGALYKTLERLADKGFVSWKTETGTPERGGLPRRRFRVTAAGMAALRASRRTLQSIWNELGEVLG